MMSYDKEYRSIRRWSIAAVISLSICGICVIVLLALKLLG